MLISADVLMVYGVFSVVLCLSIFTLAGLTGVMRTRTKTPAIADDAKMLQVQMNDVVPLELQRVLNCHRNALENIPPFLLIMLPFVFSSPSMAWVLGYMGVYTAARLAYIVCYLKGLQPWRSITYGIGTMTAGVVAIHTLVRLLG